jgi:hypothetical protein
MLMLGLDLVIGFTDTPLPAAVAAVITVLVLLVVLVVLVAAASTSSAAEDLSPTAVAAAVVVAVAVVVGAMDGRAAFSDHRRPVSCSFSLRFSLRACDFEYGARDASRPVVRVVPPKIHSFVFFFVRSKPQ